MSTISASTTSTTAYKVTADTTGTLVLQTGASPTTAVTISSSQIVTFANPPTATGAGGVSTNTAYGTSALAANTTGSQTTAVGYQAGYNTTGTNNVWMGYVAGYGVASSSTGTRNTGIGVGSLYGYTSGTSNTGVGINSLNANNSGNYNVAIGDSALLSNTTASNNTAVGYQALYTIATNGDSVALGYQAGRVATGIGNTFVGTYSGLSLTTGTYNTFVGNGAGCGYLVTTGSKNTIIGGYTGNNGGLDIRTASNYIVLSDGDGNPRAYCNNSGVWTFPGSVGSIQTDAGGNYITYTRNSNNYIYANGGTSASITVTSNTNGVTLSNGATSWVAASDINRKDIIENITDGVSKVCGLRAVIGKYKTDEEGTRRSFLIAQDVQAVLSEAVTELEDDAGKYLALAYTEVIPLLVAAIKELKAEIDTLKGQA